MVLLSTMMGCIVIETPFEGIAPGPWRGVLKLEPNPVMPNPKGEPTPEKMNLKFEEVTEGQLPFNFEVHYQSDTAFYWLIRNGEATLRLDDISFGRRPGTMQDTIKVRFPDSDSYFEGLHEDGIIEGYWRDPSRSPTYAIAFVARHGQNHRFTNLQKPPVMDITGQWQMTFDEPETDSLPAIASFQQSGNYLKAEITTAEAEYDRLIGTVQADKLYLSSFDGRNAYLIEAKITPDSNILGSFRAGTHFRTTWTAKPITENKIPDPNVN